MLLLHPNLYFLDLKTLWIRICLAWALLALCPKAMFGQKLVGPARDRLLENNFPASFFNVRPAAYPADTIEILIAGDVMMHARQLEYPWRESLEGIRSRLERADLSIVNMEFTLAGEPYSGYPSFSAPDDYARYLADCGADVFLTANNHILDKGGKGMERTMRVYREMGVPFTGIAEDSTALKKNYPLILAVKGIRIALLNFTYCTNMPLSKGQIVNHMDKPSIQAALDRAKGADFVIALPHWGEEYSLRHGVREEKLAGWLVENGVSAIVGGHPHVVQDSCMIQGPGGKTVPVFYSVGNLVSNMSAENTRLELAVALRIARDSSGHLEMLTPRAEFLWCCLPGTLTENYRTIAVTDHIGKRAQWLNPNDYDNMIQTLERVGKTSKLGTVLKETDIQ